MSHDQWTPNNNDHAMAMTGINFSRKAHNVELTPEVQAWMVQMAESKACLLAEVRWARNLLHPTEDNEKPSS